jgi:hypothetical protein
MDDVLAKEVLFMRDNRKLSRRSVLRGVATLTTAALTYGLMTSRETLAGSKASKEAMQYQEKPSEDKQCSNCVNFIPSNSCSIVEGTVSANGYCIAWAKKPGSGR